MYMARYIWGIKIHFISSLIRQGFSLNDADYITYAIVPLLKGSLYSTPLYF